MLVVVAWCGVSCAAAHVPVTLRRMRLREVKHILTENIPLLTITVVDTPLPNGQAGRKVRGATIVREAVKQIARVKGFEPDAAALLAHDILRQASDNDFIVDANVFNGFAAQLNAFQAIAERMRIIFDQVVPDQHEHTISLQIPHPGNLDDLTKTLASLRTAIEHPVSVVLREAISFQNFDSGTDWIELVAVSAVAMRFVVFLFRAATAYAKEQTTVDVYEQTARAAEVHVDYISNVQRANAQILERLIEQLSRNAIDTAGRETPAVPEEIAKVMAAIKELAKLQERGLRIQLALKASVEDRDALAELDKDLLSPAEIVKLLGAKREDDK